MKVVMICYNEAVDDEVMELLNDINVVGYTKWRKVLGRGQTSGPHMASHIWPKANNVLFTVLPEELAAEIFDGVRKIKSALGAEGIKAFMWEIEDMT